MRSFVEKFDMDHGIEYQVWNTYFTFIKGLVFLNFQYRIASGGRKKLWLNL